MRLLLLLSLSFLALSCKMSGRNIYEDFSSKEIVIQTLDNNFFPLVPTFQDGDTACFVFHSEDCLCHYCPMLVCLSPLPISVSVNGFDAQAVKYLHLINSDDACYPVSTMVHDGENVIRIKGNGGIPPIYIAGDFSLLLSDSGEWYIAPERALTIGDVVPQGLPFYGGEISYSCLYDIPQWKRFRILYIPSWKGSSCKLFVNGEFVSDIGPGRSVKNIARWLTTGINYIELRVRAYPLVFGENATQCWGLLEDFKLAGFY